MVKDSLVIGVMKDIPPPPQKIRIETPIGINIETPDDSPLLDGLIITLGFFAFCFYVYARYFKSK